MPDSLAEEFERALKRERVARKQAEQLLEAKSRELYEVNQLLRADQDKLERIVKMRTGQLTRASDRLMALISSLPFGILVEDEDRLVVLANRAYCETFSLSVEPGSLVGSSWAGTEDNAKSLFADADRYLEITSDLLARRQHRTGQHLDLKDGRVLELDFVPLTDEESPRGCLWMYRDVTERVEAKAALIEARQTAEAANQARGQFLGMMSHEMRTPLSAILGLSELVKGTNLEPTPRTYLERIHANADSLLHLIEDILDFSKIDAGQVHLHEDVFDPTLLAEEVGELMVESVCSKDLEFVVQTASNLPSQVIGDKSRIRQMLLNFVSNAIKFTEEGRIVVHLDIDENHPENIVYSVIDTGPGIPDDMLGKIFERFVRYSRAEDNDVPGTGLGLSICSSLVKMMGGEIGVDTALGRGSTFWFRLPHSGYQETSTAGSDVEATALVVDDDDVARATIVSYLSEMGLMAVGCSTVDEALRRLQRSPADILVLDNQIEGEQRLLSSVGRMKSAPRILSLCAGGVAELVGPAKSVYVAALPKPVGRRALMSAMRTLLGIEARPTNTVRAHTEAPSPQLYVLIVEDNDDSRTLLKHMLENRGFRVDLATNGREAIETFSQHQYDAVITDLSMPSMDGFEMATRIRELETNSANPRVPIIAVSAHALPGYREQCLEAGMDEYQTKPVDFGALIANINKLVDPRPVVLVVDDSEDNKLLLQAYLGKLDEFRCIYASDGVEALERCARQRVNVLLCDMLMPRMDGYTAVARLRGNPVFSELPIIAMTAHVGEDERQRCLDAGCTSFLQKPIQKAELYGAIDRALASLPREAPEVTEPETHEGAVSPQEKHEVLVSEDIIDMIPRFLENRNEDALNLSELLRDVDFDAIGRVGHNMKGSGTSYGFLRITEIGGEIEEAAKQEDALAIERLTSDLAGYLKAVVVVAVPDEL